MSQYPARLLAHVVAWLILAVVACSDVIEDPETSLMVYGQVTTSGGAAAPGVTVRLGEQAGTSCGGAYLSSQPAATDSAGRYRSGLFYLGVNQAFTACLKVVVTPPAGSGWAADSVTRAGVRFGGPDSVQVNFVLRPSA